MTAKDSARWWDKWDNAAGRFDVMNRGIELRYGDIKRRWVERATGLTLLVATGTGLDLQYFPAGHKIVGLDISPKMLDKTRGRLDAVMADTSLIRADVQMLGMKSNTIDTVVTSCTFCSVPDPVRGLQELFRVMKPGGRILMFEHVRSDIFWMGPMMDLMTYLSRMFGPDLNRRTGENIRRAGFRLTREVNVYLDMVKLFEAVKPFDSE